ncbi:GntR family transcriptional regulator [Streptomyces sp. NPDC002920]
MESTLRARIVDGTYDFGTKIPTISSLCEEFGTSLYTVEVAVGRLRTRGLLFSWPGKGTVVTDPQNPPTGPSLRVRTGPGQWETWTVLEPGRTNRSHVRTVITARIADGTYAPGHRIPSCKELAEELGASYSTVYPALKELEKRRLLGRREGKPRQLFVQPRHERDAALKAGNR